MTGASIVVLLSASPAFAAWSVSGSGSGAAKAGSLSTPSLNANSGITASAATINWTAPGGSQNSATYTATATASGHTTKSCNAAASAGSCALSGLDAATTYSVAVQASLANWVSASATTPLTTSASATPAQLVLANCAVQGNSQACNGSYGLGNAGSMVANVRAVTAGGQPATITTPITMTVSSGDTTNYKVTSGATLTIDGTATPSNQSTATFTIAKQSNASNSTTITVHVTSSPSLPDLTFTVTK